MAAGNNVLDGETMDDFSTKLKICENRLSALEDFTKKVEFIEQNPYMSDRNKLVNIMFCSLKDATPCLLHVLLQ